MVVGFYDFMSATPHERIASARLDEAGRVVIEASSPGLHKLVSEPSGFMPDLVDISEGQRFLDGLLLRFFYSTGVRAVREEEP